MVKLKKFFNKIFGWFKNHIPTRRRLIQIYTALLFNCNIKGYFGKGTSIIYQGGTKSLCAPALNCYSCPGAIASCPLGALQNALASSGTRTPYYVIGILALLGLMLGRTICGFLCPMGLGQELLFKIKSPKVKKSGVTRILSYFKYVLLVVFVIAIPLLYNTVPGFCKYICPAGTSASVLQLANPNNPFYEMLGFLFSWKFILLIVFIVGSIFFYRFFCRFFCPLGAIYGFFNKFCFIGVSLDREKCTECGLCIQTCQMDIKHVSDHECIQCGACVNVCPTKAITWKGSQIFLHAKQVSPAVQTANETPSLAGVLEGKGTVDLSVETSTASAPALADMVKKVEVTEEQAAEEKVEVTENAVEAAEENSAEEVAKELPEPCDKRVNGNKNSKRGFILKIVSICAAALVFVTALVYYNFLAPVSASTVFKVGDKCPDFTLETVYDSAAARNEKGEKVITKFSSNVTAGEGVLSSKGKVTVINFWYTTCGPCVSELPGFNRVKEEYGDQILIVAVHDSYRISEDIQKFIDEPTRDKADSWTDWNILFTLDNDQTKLYETLGGTSAYPMTVIVNAQGIITKVVHGSYPEQNLRKDIAEVLN